MDEEAKPGPAVDQDWKDEDNASSDILMSDFNPMRTPCTSLAPSAAANAPADFSVAQSEISGLNPLVTPTTSDTASQFGGFVNGSDVWGANGLATIDEVPKPPPAYLQKQQAHDTETPNQQEALICDISDHENDQEGSESANSSPGTAAGTTQDDLECVALPESPTPSASALDGGESDSDASNAPSLGTFEQHLTQAAQTSTELQDYLQGLRSRANVVRIHPPVALPLEGHKLESVTSRRPPPCACPSQGQRLSIATAALDHQPTLHN